MRSNILFIGSVRLQILDSVYQVYLCLQVSSHHNKPSFILTEILQLLFQNIQFCEFEQIIRIKQIQQIMTKNTGRYIYTVTYLSYVGIHILRTTYSFNKNSLLKQLNSTKVYLGILDFIMIFSLGIGHLYHAWYPQPKTTFGLSLAMLTCAISFFFIPFVMTIFESQFFQKIIIFLLMMINGYSQSYIWPGLLAIVSQEYKNKNLLLSFWVTCTNSGNILGFLMCNAFVIWLDFPWMFCYFVAFIFLTICALLTNFQLKQSKAQEINILLNNEIKQDHQERYSLNMSLKAIIFDPIIRDLSIIFAVQKSVTYGLIFWLPLYFQELGLNNKKAWIMICYEISSVFGSSFIGYLFKHLNISYGAFLLPIFISLFLCFIVFKYVKLTLGLYFMLISICGVLLGGSYNSVSGVIVISLTKKLPQYLHKTYVGFYSDATMAIGNITTSFTQILIGIVSSFSNNIKYLRQLLVFLVFLIYCTGGLITIFHLKACQKNALPSEQSKTEAKNAIQLSNMQS